MTLILRCDIAGTPVAWLSAQDAAKYYALNRVQWDFGQTAVKFRGGFSAISGLQSELEVKAIISVSGRVCESIYQRSTPPLCNPELFRRDRNTCLYCAQVLPASLLTRDHVIPSSKGGANSWENCVSACKRCNQHKANRTPESAGMTLLAVPYAPNHAEYLILSNRTIIIDQMDFLRTRIGRNSRMVFT